MIVIASKKVAISASIGDIEYPAAPPFSPDREYPELKFRVYPERVKNAIYKLARQLLIDMGLDQAHIETPQWNPFGVIIKPGQKVLVKPNMVRHFHLGGGNFNSVITHGSLVRFVLDYVGLALKGQGEITVGDAPVQSADFNKLLEITGLRQICDEVSNIWQIPVRLIDFRLMAIELDERHCIVKRSVLEGDTKGYLSVNLGGKSLLKPLEKQSSKFRVSSYDCQMMREHHNEITHEYLIPRTVLESDVVLNIPKLKTHRKVGLTACLKNLVGINGHKDWLPHHRTGSIEEGGDEYHYPSLIKRVQDKLAESMGDDWDFNPKKNIFRRLGLKALDPMARHLAKDAYTEGSWYGNDTLWRTVLDLNRLLIYADKDGKMRATPQRKCFNIVDAIIAGEKEGPMEPDPRPLGLLIGGVNPVAVDTVLSTMIGFDYKKIPLISNGFNRMDWPLVNFGPMDIEIISEDVRLRGLRIGRPFNEFNFKAPSGWAGHVEKY